MENESSVKETERGELWLLGGGEGKKELGVDGIAR